MGGKKSKKKGEEGSGAAAGDSGAVEVKAEDSKITKGEAVKQAQATLDISNKVRGAKAEKEYSLADTVKGTTIQNATKEQGVIEVEIDSMKKSLEVYGCNDATIVCNGKVANVAIDGCKSTKVIVDTVVASIEISNCVKMQVQVKGLANGIAIDKTDGCMVYISENCLENEDFSITAAKCSEMNVQFPWGEDYREKPLPEQFVYKIDKSGEEPKIVASVSDLYAS